MGLFSHQCSIQVILPWEMIYIWIETEAKVKKKNVRSALLLIRLTANHLLICQYWEMSKLHVIFYEKVKINCHDMIFRMRWRESEALCSIIMIIVSDHKFERWVVECWGRCDSQSRGCDSHFIECKQRWSRGERGGGGDWLLSFPILLSSQQF